MEVIKVTVFLLMVVGGVITRVDSGIVAQRLPRSSDNRIGSHLHLSPLSHQRSSKHISDFGDADTIRDCVTVYNKIISRDCDVTCANKSGLFGCLIRVKSASTHPFLDTVASGLGYILQHLAGAPGKSCDDKLMRPLAQLLRELLEGLGDTLTDKLSSLSGRRREWPRAAKDKHKCITKQMPAITVNLRLTCRITIACLECILEKLGIHGDQYLYEDILKIERNLHSMFLSLGLACTIDLRNVINTLSTTSTPVGDVATTTAACERNVASSTVGEPTTSTTIGVPTTTESTTAMEDTTVISTTEGQYEETTAITSAETTTTSFPDFDDAKTVDSCVRGFRVRTSHGSAMTCPDISGLTYCLLRVMISPQPLADIDIPALGNLVEQLAGGPGELCKDGLMDALRGLLLNVLGGLVETLRNELASLPGGSPVLCDVVRAKRECNKTLPAIHVTLNNTCPIIIDYLECIVRNLGIDWNRLLNENLLDMDRKLELTLRRLGLVCTIDIREIINRLMRRSSPTPACDETTATTTVTEPTTSTMVIQDTADTTTISEYTTEITTMTEPVPETTAMTEPVTETKCDPEPATEPTTEATVSPIHSPDCLQMTDQACSGRDDGDYCVCFPHCQTGIYIACCGGVTNIRNCSEAFYGTRGSYGARRMVYSPSTKRCERSALYCPRDDDKRMLTRK